MLAAAAGKDGDSKRGGSFVRSVVLGSYDVFLEKGFCFQQGCESKKPDLHAGRIFVLPSGRGMFNAAHLVAKSAVASLV
jgi:hypothetical protein